MWNLLYLKKEKIKHKKIVYTKKKNGEKKMKNIPDNLAEKMNEIKGQELKYGPLCESLGINGRYRGKINEKRLNHEAFSRFSPYRVNF